MIHIKRFPYIKINLEPGIYRFSNYSATGKTYLGYLIKEYQSVGENLAVYSYGDHIRNKSIDSVISPNDKVLLLDRYDKYSREEDDKIITAFVASGGIVLIDCKQVENIYSDYEFCDIALLKEGIEVTLWSMYLK